MRNELIQRDSLRCQQGFSEEEVAFMKAHNLEPSAASFSHMFNRLAEFRGGSRVPMPSYKHFRWWDVSKALVESWDSPDADALGPAREHRK